MLWHIHNGNYINWSTAPIYIYIYITHNINLCVFFFLKKKKRKTSNMQPKTFLVPVHRTGLFLSKKKEKEKNTQKIWSPSIWTRWFGIRHGNPLLFTFILIAPLTLFIIYYLYVIRQNEVIRLPGFSGFHQQMGQYPSRLSEDRRVQIQDTISTVGCK